MILVIQITVEANAVQLNLHIFSFWYPRPLTFIAIPPSLQIYHSSPFPLSPKPMLGSKRCVQWIIAGRKAEQ